MRRHQEMKRHGVLFREMILAFACALKEVYAASQTFNYDFAPSVLLKRCAVDNLETNTVYFRLSDETLNRGPDSLWSLKIKNPMALLVKSRGVTPVSWPNSHHWPLSIMTS